MQTQQHRTKLDEGTYVNFKSLFKTMTYPAGESHVELKEAIIDGSVIECDNIRNFEDIGNIITAADILDHLGVRDITWFIPYFPFGRHDRRRFKGDGLEPVVAMDMLAPLNVVTLDPHSELTAQIPHIPQSEVVRFYSKLNDPDILFVIPDAGATKKALTWLNGADYIQGYKHRDTKTGKLTEFSVDHDFQLVDRECVIVDDICDAGGTFLGLAKVLKDKGANQLTLAVTHGLFTKGMTDLLKIFNRIITTSTYETNTKRVTVVPYRDLYTGSIQI